MEIVMQPVNEDQRRYDAFDERLLRSALALRENDGSDPPVTQPAWLSIEQPWADESERKKRKKAKKKKKRRRNGEECDGEEEEKRKKKKMKE